MELYETHRQNCIEYLHDCIFKYVYKFVEGTEIEPITKCCFTILRNQQFLDGYGSKGKHHSYKGALPIHTAEVMQNALATASSFGIVPGVDLKVIVVAVLFHDYLKIRDYDENGEPTEFKKNIYHVAGGYAEWVYLARINGVEDQDFIDKVGHCILSHHGRREYKACVEPQTLEALIIHQADMLSAHYGRYAFLDELYLRKAVLEELAVYDKEIKI